MGFLQNFRPCNNKKGFTLIEMIAVIVLVGIISAVLGLAIVQGVKSYVFARTNVAFSQKARLAIARMERELGALTGIDDVDSNQNCVCYTRETASRYFRTISLNGTQLNMHAPAGEDADCTDTQGNLLIDNVESFSLEYEDNEENLSSTPPAELENLRAIHVDLSLSRPDRDSTEDFSLVISPRNNGMLNAPGDG